MPTRRTFDAFFATVLIGILARLDDRLGPEIRFAELAQAEYDREFWDMVGAFSE